MEFRPSFEEAESQSPRKDTLTESLQTSEESSERPHIEVLRDAVSPETRAQVDAIVTGIEASLLAYSLRPSADEEILHLSRDFSREIFTALSYGDGQEPLPKENTLNVKAALYGAGRIMESPEMRVMTDPDGTNGAIVQRFSELAEDVVLRSVPPHDLGATPLEGSPS